MARRAALHHCDSVVVGRCAEKTVKDCASWGLRMILSRTCQYAIQALVFIATQPDSPPVLARAIAAHLDVPAPYLAKIMQRLSRARFVESFRGPKGGFRLREGVRGTTIMAVAAVMEPPDAFETCLLGLKACEDGNPCPMHHDWKPIKQTVLALLTRKTIGQLEAAVRTGEYRIADLPLRMFARHEPLPVTRPPRRAVPRPTRPA